MITTKIDNKIIEAALTTSLSGDIDVDRNNDSHDDESNSNSISSSNSEGDNDDYDDDVSFRGSMNSSSSNDYDDNDNDNNKYSNNNKKSKRIRQKAKHLLSLIDSEGDDDGYHDDDEFDDEYSYVDDEDDHCSLKCFLTSTLMIIVLIIILFPFVSVIVYYTMFHNDAVGANSHSNNHYHSQYGGGGGSHNDNNINKPKAFPEELIVNGLYKRSDFITIGTNSGDDYYSSSSSSSSSTITTETKSKTILPYWENYNEYFNYYERKANKTNIRGNHNHDLSSLPKTWGPCYPPSNQEIHLIDWKHEISYYYHNNNNTTGTTSSHNQLSYGMKNYILQNKNNGMNSNTYSPNKKEMLYDVCKPGFLIIGAGKCGTSSLYHYLTDGHPRILPASKKQIHYYKYFSEKSMAWYLNHFPTSTSFLASGALITGEASPGYLPYPNIPFMIHKRLKKLYLQQEYQQQNTPKLSDMTITSGSHEKKNIDMNIDDDMFLPKIIIAGRNPIDRAYSSYKYSYVTEAMNLMKKGKMHKPSLIACKHNITLSGEENKDLLDECYRSFLFTFEELIEVELNHLKKCLGTGGHLSNEAGYGYIKTKQYWLPPKSKPKGEEDTTGTHTHTEQYDKISNEYKYRHDNNLPPLIDIQMACYGPNQQYNKDVPREQYTDLISKQPDKALNHLKNFHLIEQLIGRSLYTLPLEWWYISFKPTNIYFICTEELGSSNELDSLVYDFMGLPYDDDNNNSNNKLDWTKVTNKEYNVGFHQGYDTSTSIKQIKEHQEHSSSSGSGSTRSSSNNSDNNNNANAKNKYPLSDKMYLQLKYFLNPYNQRLYELTKRKCVKKWE